MLQGNELVAKIYEIAKNWASECYEEVYDVKSAAGYINAGYIELCHTQYYLVDIIKLQEMLKEINVEITTIEAPGADDEGMLIWFAA